MLDSASKSLGITKVKYIEVYSETDPQSQSVLRQYAGSGKMARWIKALKVKGPELKFPALHKSRRSYCVYNPNTAG